jgi:hypothetical protein
MDLNLKSVKKMKRIGSLLILMGILFGCNSANHQRSERKVSLAKEKPAYKKDKQLDDYVEKSVHPGGASGSGYGESYASFSYRQSAIKNSRKKIKSGIPELNFINKYDQTENFKDASIPQSCTWHSPLKLNIGMTEYGAVCSIKK